MVHAKVFLAAAATAFSARSGTRREISTYCNCRSSFSSLGAPSRARAAIFRLFLVRAGLARNPVAVVFLGVLCFVCYAPKTLKNRRFSLSVRLSTRAQPNSLEPLLIGP